MRADYGAADVERRVVEPAKSAALPEAAAVGRRSDFARDRARVLHSGGFRRLAGKTQVVAPDEEDAVPRTRLTHSLEVAQIAREIGAALGCDPDLTDLAGLAHDIGHPPFGHNGEHALDEIAGAAGGFEANAQNLRLLARLEAKVLDGDGRSAGLNLTRAALDAVVKYPWPRPDRGGKFGVYPSELAVFDWLRRDAPAGVQCLESQVMDWADDVAYSVHDVEDGVTAGRIELARLADPAERDAVAEVAAVNYSDHPAGELARVLTALLDLPAVRAGVSAAPGLAAASAVKQLTSELTGRLASGAVAATRAAAGAGPLHRYDAALSVPELLRAEVAVLKAIAFRYVMDDPARRAAQQQQREVLSELVAALADRGESALDPVFRDLYRIAPDDQSRLRVVIDQVALLTDAQAYSRHRRLVVAG